MHYRPATVEDLDEICCLIRRAIELMEQQGIYQWDEQYTYVIIY